MWNWNLRSRPPVNYIEVSDEDDYTSPPVSPGTFVSPRRPRQAGSPVRDPVEQDIGAVLAEANQRLAEITEDTMVNFEDENGVDEAGALGAGLRSLEKLEWDDKDLAFFFNRVETRMGSAGVKKELHEIPNSVRNLTFKGPKPGQRNPEEEPVRLPEQ